MRHRVHRSWLPLLPALLAVLVVLPTIAGPTDAASLKWTAKCDTRIRTYPSTTSRTNRVKKATHRSGLLKNSTRPWSRGEPIRPNAPRNAGDASGPARHRTRSSVRTLADAGPETVSERLRQP